MEEYKFCYKNILCFMLLGIPMLLQASWIFLDTKIPVSDGGAHYYTASAIYFSFKDNFLNGLYFTFHTGGKPILFSIFAVPFVAIFSPNDMAAVKYFSAVSQAALLLAYYWMFLYWIEKSKAAIYSGLISTLPFFFSINSQFMPEVVWQIWFVIFLGCLFRSEKLKKFRYSVLAGFFLSMTVLARPVESVILIFPAMLVMAIYYGKAVEFGLVTLIVSSVFCSAAIAINFYISWMAFDWRYGGASFFILAVCFIVQRFIETRSTGSSAYRKNLLYFILIFGFIVSAWVLFYGRHIYFWTFDNSFGDGARVNDQVNLHRNIFSIFILLLNSYAKLASSILILFCIFMYAFLFKKKSFFECRGRYLVLLCFALFLLPMLCAYSITGTSDNRRIILGMISFYVSMILFIDLNSYRWPEVLKSIYFCAVGVVYFAQIISILFADFGNAANTFLLKNLLANKTGLNYKSPNNNPTFDDELIKKIMAAGVSNKKIAVYSLGLFSDKENYQTESLRYVTLHYDKSLIFANLWGYTDYEPMDNVVRRLIENRFDYIVLENFENPISSKSERERLRSHTFFISDALNSIKKNGLKSIPGLIYVDTFIINGKESYFYKVYDTSSPKVVTSSVLEQYSGNGLWTSVQPGWHAEKTPAYPQFIEYRFSTMNEVKKIDFLPQEGNISRFPKDVDIEISKDGNLWEKIDSFKLDCALGSNEWQSVVLKSRIKSKFFRFLIRSNCGDNQFLTLRGLKFS